MARKHAFTLIELLVVVAIIALLISILIPSLAAAREQARGVLCGANLRSMGQAMVLYANDNGGSLPGPLHPPVFRETGMSFLGNQDPSGFDPMNPETEVPWFLLARIAEYAGGEGTMLDAVDKLATCPTASTRFDDERFLPETDGGLAGNPSWSRPYNYLVSTYGTLDSSLPFYFGLVNIGSTWEGVKKVLAREPNKKPKKIEIIPRTAEEWAVGDAWWGNPINLSDNPFLGKDFVNPGTWTLRPADVKDGSGGSQNPLPREPYHGRGKNPGANLLFFDGHVEMERRVEEEWVDAYPANRVIKDN